MRSLLNFLSDAAAGVKSKRGDDEVRCRKFMQMGSLKGILRLLRNDQRLMMVGDEVRSEEAPHATPSPPSRISWSAGVMSSPSSPCSCSPTLVDESSLEEICKGLCRSSISLRSSGSTTASDFGLQAIVHKLGGECLRTANWVAIEVELDRRLSDSDSACSSDDEGKTRRANFLTVDDGGVCVREMADVPVYDEVEHLDDPPPSLAKKTKPRRTKVHPHHHYHHDHHHHHHHHHHRPGVVVVSVGRHGGKKTSKKSEKSHAPKRMRKADKKKATDMKKTVKARPFHFLSTTNHLWKVHRTGCGQAFHLRHISGYWLALDEDGRLFLDMEVPCDDDAFVMVFPRKRPSSLSW